MRIFILLALLFSSFSAFAQPLSFPDHNFSIEPPADWDPVSPQPPQTLLALQSPDAAKKLLVFAASIPPQQRSTSAREVRAGAKESMAAQGIEIGPERPLTIGGTPFVVFTGRVTSGSTVAAYSGAAGDEVYMIQTIKTAGDAETDWELQAAVRSFKLLTPPTSQPVSGMPVPFVERAGYIFGQLFVFVFIPAAVIMTLIKRTTKSK